MRQSDKTDERNLSRLQQQAYPKDTVEGRVYSVLRRVQLPFQEIQMRRLLLSTIAATVLVTGLRAQAPTQSTQTPNSTAGTVQNASKKSAEKTSKHHHHHKHHHKKS
jgi:hypothetical protein